MEIGDSSPGNDTHEIDLQRPDEDGILRLESPHPELNKLVSTLQQPSVRVLHVVKASIESDEYISWNDVAAKPPPTPTPWTLPIDSLNLNKLHFEDTYIVEDNIADIIESCIKLRSFHYTQNTFYGPAGPRYAGMIDMDIMKPALDRHTDHLGSLHFSIGAYGFRNMGNVDPDAKDQEQIYNKRGFDPRIASYADYTTLKTLSVRLSTIVSTSATSKDWFNALPQALESLTIHDLDVKYVHSQYAKYESNNKSKDAFEYAPGFMAFAKTIPRKFDKLKRVRMVTTNRENHIAGTMILENLKHLWNSSKSLEWSLKWMRFRCGRAGRKMTRLPRRRWRPR